MFGDPVTNPRGWEVRRVGDLLAFLTSGLRGWARYYCDSGSTFLRIQNVGRNELRLDDLAYVDAPRNAEAERTRIKEGDVLLSITADLGRTGVVSAQLAGAYINQHLAILRPPEVNPYYLSAFIASEGGQSQIRRLNRGGVKAGLNFDDVRSIAVMLPPLDRQGNYQDIVERRRIYVDKLLVSMQEIDLSLGDSFRSLLIE